MDYRPLVVVRTHLFDATTEAFLRFLDGAGHEILVVADEAWGPVHVPPHRASVRLDPAYLAAMGLALPPRFGWLCGDYALYLAARARPGATHFWLIEPDVHVGFADAAELFGPFRGHLEEDLIGAYYFGRDERWANTAPMRPFARGGEVYGILFPFLRVSAAAVSCMLERRREVGARFAAGEVAQMPNDEAFTATVLTEAGMACRDLNGFGRTLYTTESFFFGPPLARRDLLLAAPTRLLHHPAAAGRALLHKACDALRATTSPEVLARMAALAPAIEEECGPEAAAHLREVAEGEARRIAA